MHAVGDKVSRHKAFPGQDNNHWCPVIHLGGEREALLKKIAFP